jgi:hypothetical protein
MAVSGWGVGAMERETQRCGGFPRPIKNLELRDAVCDLLREALSDPRRAAPLYLLRTLGDMWHMPGGAEAAGDALPAAPEEEALRRAGAGDSSQRALDTLLQHGLVQCEVVREGTSRVRPGRELLAELGTAIERIEACCRAVEALHRRSPTADDEVARSLEQAACLFNEGLFFEAHELLEAVWLRQAGETRTFLQGLIQLAAGFHHLENRNVPGALSLLAEGHKKLAGHRPGRVAAELDQFLEQVAGCHRVIASLGPEACERFDRRMIPRLRLPA